MTDLRDKIKELGIQQYQIAVALGRDPSRISRWLSGDEIIPAELAKKLHVETGIPLCDIRPDLWEPAQ